MAHPMPADKVRGGTVVASVIYREGDTELPEDRYTLLLLNDRPPFYTVGIYYQPDGASAWCVDGYDTSYHNINEAVGDYAQLGGDH